MTYCNYVYGFKILHYCMSANKMYSIYINVSPTCCVSSLLLGWTKSLVMMPVLSSSYSPHVFKVLPPLNYVKDHVKSANKLLIKANSPITKPLADKIALNWTTENKKSVKILFLM